MILSNKTMYVLRKKDTNKYKKNNGYFEALDNSKSAIKLYETAALCESAVRGYRNYQDNFDIVKVKVSISIQE